MAIRKPSIPSSAEQRGARIEACPEPVEGGAANAASRRKTAPFDTASTSFRPTQDASWLPSEWSQKAYRPLINSSIGA